MAYEDFTTYTESDSGNDITVAENTITIVDLPMNLISYVRKSFGAGHFGDFEHLVSGKPIDDDLTSAGYRGFWAISTSASSSYQLMADNNEGIIFTFAYVSGERRFYVKDLTNDNSDTYVGYVSDSQYWFTIERSSTTLTVKIYSDSGRTVLVDTLTITCTTDTYEYIYPCSNRDHSAGTDPADWFVYDLDLQEGGAPATGYMSCKNYLEGG